MQKRTGASACFEEDQIYYATANLRHEENISLKSNLFLY